MLTVLFGWFLASVPLVRAAEAARATVLIFVETTDDRALVERVRGQVSDLDLELWVVEQSPGSPREVPAHSRAVALVWFTRSNRDVDRVVVHAAAADGDPEPTLAREIGAGRPTPDGELSSATLEAAALVVREALRTLIVNEPAAPEPPAPEAPAPKPPPRPPTKAALERPPSSVPAAEGAHFRAEATWELVLDGVGPFRRQGPGLRLGAACRGVELSALVASSLPVTEEDQHGAIRLRRHVVGLGARQTWRLSAPVSLQLGAVGGVALYQRKALRLDPAVSASGDQLSPSALFGPEVRLGWAPGSGPLELGLMAAVHAVPEAPRIGYRIDGRFEPSFVIWRVQPSVGVSLKFLEERR